MQTLSLEVICLCKNFDHPSMRVLHTRALTSAFLFSIFVRGRLELHMIQSCNSLTSFHSVTAIRAVASSLSCEELLKLFVFSSFVRLPSLVISMKQMTIFCLIFLSIMTISPWLLWPEMRNSRGSRWIIMESLRRTCTTPHLGWTKASSMPRGLHVQVETAMW